MMGVLCHKKGFTTLTALISVAMIAVGLTAGIALVRMQSAQTTQSEASENTQFIEYVYNELIGIQINGPFKAGNSDYGIDGALCFHSEPPAANGQYRVELKMRTKSNPNGEVIGASASQNVTNTTPVVCAPNESGRKDSKYSAYFNIPDKSEWSEACPQIEVHVTTGGKWNPQPSSLVAKLKRELLCPEGVIEPTDSPEDNSQSSDDSSGTGSGTGSSGGSDTDQDSTPATQDDDVDTNDQTGQSEQSPTSTTPHLRGRITVFSCNQPDSVTLSVCNESQTKCSNIPLVSQPADHGIWPVSNAEDRSYVYSYSVTEDPDGGAIREGKKYIIKRAEASVKHFLPGIGATSYTSKPENEGSVMPNASHDLFIETGEKTCSCTFKARSYVKDAATGNITNALDGGGKYGISNELQIIQSDTPGLAFTNGIVDTGEIDFWKIRPNTDAQFGYGPYGVDGLAYIRLYAPDYNVVKQECTSYGEVHACPGEEKVYENTVFADDNAGKDFKGLRVACGANLEYGWVVEKKPESEQNPQVPPPGGGNGGNPPGPPPSRDGSNDPIRVSNNALLNELTGFGAGTTGGKDGTILHVTRLDDNPAFPDEGSLRWALESEHPAIVVFDVNGQIELKEDILVASNKTLDGRGSDIIITKFGLDILNAQNVIITNVTIQGGHEAGQKECTTDSTGDAIQIRNSHHVWIHRVTLAYFCDGLLDIVNGSHNITISHSFFHDHSKTMLIGNSVNRGAEDVNITATLHHNRFMNLIQRIPRVRFGKVDVYNNYYHNWHSYAVGHSMDSQVILENNVIEPGPNTDRDDPNFTSKRVGDDPREGFVRSEGNFIIGRATANSHRAEKVFTRPYQVSIDPANEQLKNSILQNAGAKPREYYLQNFGSPFFSTDINGDSVVNTTDLVICSDEYGIEDDDPACDVDRNSKVDAIDYSAVINAINNQ